MTDPIPPAHPAIKADGRAVRAMRKRRLKLNTNPKKHKTGTVHLAKHSLIHRGGHRG